MTNMSKTFSVPISRRCLLLGAVRASGGATILTTAAIQSARAAKASQKIVKYQETPKGNQMCSKAFCSSELVPDRRWNDQPERLVYRLSEGVATFWHSALANASMAVVAMQTMLPVRGDLGEQF
jgi:hypothetical protein